MLIISVWQKWLDSFGGPIAFLLSMIIFFGGYTFLVGRLNNPSVGLRRALALFCLMVGLFIGILIGNLSEVFSEEAMRHSQPSIIFKFLASIALAAGVYFLGLDLIQPGGPEQRKNVLIGSAIAGVLFLIFCPRITLAALVVLIFVSWFIIRLVRRIV